MDQKEQIEKLIRMNTDGTLSKLVGKTFHIFSQECIIVGAPKKIFPGSCLLLITNNIDPKLWLPLHFVNIQDSLKNRILNSRTELLKELIGSDPMITNPELFNSPKYTHYGFISLTDLLIIRPIQIYKIDFTSYLGNIIKEIQNELI
jgi:hypothetical protein